MDTDRTLSEIAREVLTQSPETDSRSLREKAGLLALLNLLGIVESFYADGETQGASINLIKSIAENAVMPPPQTEPVKEADLASSVMSLASKFLGGTQGQGGFDPALVSTLLGAVSAMSKARSLGPRPAVQAAVAEPDEKSDDVSDDGESTVGADVDDENTKEAEKPAEAQKPSPPSPLQQILGIDPRIITLALNVLADLMKARNAGAPDKHASSSPQWEPPETASVRDEPRTEVTVTPDGKTVVIPRPRREHRERLYHKPGLGIYRQKPDKAQAAAE